MTKFNDGEKTPTFVFINEYLTCISKKTSEYKRSLEPDIVRHAAAMTDFFVVLSKP